MAFFIVIFLVIIFALVRCNREPLQSAVAGINDDEDETEEERASEAKINKRY